MGFVLKVGFEPTQLALLPPEDSASTFSPLEHVKKQQILQELNLDCLTTLAPVSLLSSDSLRYDKHVLIDVKSCNLAEPTYSLFCVDFVIGINTQPQYLLFLQN